jgi:hypothetical protein
MHHCEYKHVGCSVGSDGDLFDFLLLARNIKIWPPYQSQLHQEAFRNLALAFSRLYVLLLVARHVLPPVSASLMIGLFLTSADQPLEQGLSTLTTLFAAFIIALRWSASFITSSNPPFFRSAIVLALLLARDFVEIPREFGRREGFGVSHCNCQWYFGIR